MASSVTISWTASDVVALLESLEDDGRKGERVLVHALAQADPGRPVDLKTVERWIDGRAIPDARACEALRRIDDHFPRGPNPIRWIGDALGDLGRAHDPRDPVGAIIERAAHDRALERADVEAWIAGVRAPDESTESMFDQIRSRIPSFHITPRQRRWTVDHIVALADRLNEGRRDGALDRLRWALETIGYSIKPEALENVYLGRALPDLDLARALSDVEDLADTEILEPAHAA